MTSLDRPRGWLGYASRKLMIATQQRASPAVEGKAGVSATSDTVCGLWMETWRFFEMQRKCLRNCQIPENKWVKNRKLLVPRQNSFLYFDFCNLVYLGKTQLQVWLHNLELLSCRRVRKWTRTDFISPFRSEIFTPLTLAARSKMELSALCCTCKWENRRAPQTSISHICFA